MPQLAALFSVLPHDDVTELTGLLPKEQAERIQALASQREVTARTLMSTEYLTAPKDARAADVLRTIRTSKPDARRISYVGRY